jgi:hypothetical protein
MTALFKNQQQENLPARDRRDWNEIDSHGALRILVANNSYAASFQAMDQYRGALLRHMDSLLNRLAAGESHVRSWRERMGKAADWPLHAPTDVERAMVAEIAELRAQHAVAPDAMPGWERGIVTVTLNGHQLREALEFINPDGARDPDQLNDELTFGIVQHKDDESQATTGMCCWNGDSDGVLPLDNEPRAAQIGSVQGEKP